MKSLRLFGSERRRRRSSTGAPALVHEVLEARQLLSAVSVSSDPSTDTSAVAESDLTAAELSEILVRFHDGFDVDAQLDAQTNLVGPSQVGHLSRGFVGDSQLFEVNVTSSTDPQALLAHYHSLPSVDYAELNSRGVLAAVPNDPQLSTQWALDYVNATDAWDTATDSSPITVAIIDSGIQTDHPDLRDNIWRNTDETAGNGIDDDGNGYVDDYLGVNMSGSSSDFTPGAHGTFVAGVVGAKGNNATGVAGATWNASLMNIRVSPDIPVGEMIRAIDYAVDNGAKVINASWGRYFDSPALFDAVKRAESAGVLMVAASGNFGKNIDESPSVWLFPLNRGADVFPAEYSNRLSNVLTVASIDRSGELSAFSNYSRTQVQLAAPGAGILSTTVGSGYATDSGTSYAAPLVAGAAALVWAQNPEMSYQDVKNILLETARPENLDRVGYGTLDMGAALRLSQIVTDSGVFDAQLYLDLNEDVANSVGRDNLAGAREHWIRHGVSDGRVASTVFDVQLYRKLNPDLEEAFGDDYQKYFVHWQDYGLAEGRTASTVFDVRTYQRNHADLVEAFGTDNFEALVDHWLTYGLNEGRRASATFDVVHYRDQHPDVASHFGRDNYKEITRHWMSHGVFEGRESSREFDVQYYLSQHGDLRRAFGSSGYEAALEHFVEYGQAEGRRTNEQFGIDAYRRRYRDLNRAFGRDFDALWDHWFRYGQFEGRDPS